jgi:nucleotide-binding universal stress UspA family protein
LIHISNSRGIVVENSPMKLLLAVDGSSTSDNAARYLIGMVKELGPLEVHVVNVQPPVTYLELLTSAEQERIDHWSQRAGREASKSAQSLLDRAGIPYTLHIVAGYLGEAIVNVANEEGCDLIVMGTRGMSAIANLVLGSVAMRVIQLAEVPVMLVK